MKKPVPNLSCEPLASGDTLIHDANGTVAIVTEQGLIDWLRRRPGEPGPRLRQVVQQTHLSYVLGLKLQVLPPTPSCTPREAFQFVVSPDRRQVTVIARGLSSDGAFASLTEATLAVHPPTGEYAWSCLTTLTCIAPNPLPLKAIEYNNVYPGQAGRCFLYAPHKQFHSTLAEAADGTVWEFPHQHLMHYSRKLDPISFPEQGMAGFFGEQTGSPAVLTHRCTLPVRWGICDMYYDLHCMAWPPGEFAPGAVFEAEYTVRYLSPAESRGYTGRARRIPLDAEDYQRCHYPRFELGMNRFDEPVGIDRFDDASGFRPQPPHRVWEEQTGHGRRGALRLYNADPTENVWTTEPPTQIPPGTRLAITALARTREVIGKGFFIRLRYHTFRWHPEPHVEWVKTLVSPPLTGSTDDWVRLEVPLLEVPPEHLDYLVAIDVVLDGTGTAWLTDVDVDLVYARQPVPAM